MRLSTDDYSVEYDPQTATVTCSGVMRLYTREYTSIIELLAQATNGATALNMDLTGLNALNSSGITAFARFVLDLNQRPELDVRVRGSRQVPWQPKSLANLKLLLPRLVLEWDD